MKFLIKDFFSKWNQIPRKLRIWSHLLKKSLFVQCKHFYSLNFFLSISFIYFIYFIFAQLFLWSICLFQTVLSITSQRFAWFLEAKQILEYTKHVLLACVLWCSRYRYCFFICIYSCFCNWISILFKILYFLTFRSILGIQFHYYDLYGFVVLYGLIFYIYLFLINTALKVVVFGVILVHIFPHSDWIRKNFNYK